MEDFNTMHGGHRERLRQRIQNEQADHLAAHELLEFVLCFSIPRQNVNALAHRLLGAFGSIRGVLNAGQEDIMRLGGVGLSTADWLYRIGKCANACDLILAENRILLDNYARVFEFARESESLVSGPCCIQLCLDAESRLIMRSRISSDENWTLPENMHAALGEVIATKARNVILMLICNETDIPRQCDIESAEKYAFMLNELNCNLLDMIVLNREHLASLRRAGCIPGFSQSQYMHALQERYLQPEENSAPEN